MKRGPLLRVSLRIRPEAEEAVVALMTEVLAQPPCVYTDAATGITTAMAYLDPPPGFTSRQRLRFVEGLRQLRAAGVPVGAIRISLARVRREDWVRSWRRHFRAFEVGRLLLVKPGWSRRKPRSGEKVVVLDPGLSFGTGQHPTTRFCLEETVASRRPGVPQSFLDVGTGSGILAIAAAKLGYGPVQGFDYDGDAVRVARQNARRNRVENALQLRRLDLTRLGPAFFPKQHVICANLTADLLLAHRRRLLGWLRREGVLVLAGILDQQFHSMSEAIIAEGFTIKSSHAEGEWKSGAFVRTP